jgi:hypothetical protein
MKQLFVILFLAAFTISIEVIAQQDSIDIFISNQMRQQGISGLSVGIIKKVKVI